MYARKWIVSGLLALVFTSGRAQQEQRFVLLPTGEVKNAMQLYDIREPIRIKGSWQPAKPEIDGLETNLPHISELTPLGWTSKLRIQHPDQYYRQYLGVVVSGQKRILVNAFCEVESNPDWREHFVFVLDGATCYWHALYDPYSAAFTNLEINGRA